MNHTRRAYRGFQRLGLIIAFASLALAGCGPQRVPVSGMVQLDGSTLSEAFVSFTSSEGGRPVSTVTDGSGSFVVSSKQGEGLMPGKYYITVSKVELKGLPSDSTEDGLMPDVIDPSGMVEQWTTPRKYANPKKSGLSVDVEAGMEPVELVLTSD